LRFGVFFVSGRLTVLEFGSCHGVGEEGESFRGLLGQFALLLWLEARDSLGQRQSYQALGWIEESYGEGRRGFIVVIIWSLI
jgi:hypothetical protein